MYQHPIPQNVTGYQFRLIGDMTIKQFLLLLAGGAVGVFFYLTNLFGPLKWVLIFGSVAFGAALAFVPIEERPLDQWLVAFFRAIYRPTHFIWEKKLALPGFFSFTPTSKVLPTDSEELAQAAAMRKKQGILSYLQTLPHQESLTQLEVVEQTQLEYIAGILNNTPLPPPTNVIPKPTIEISVAPTTKLGIDTTPTSLTQTKTDPVLITNTQPPIATPKPLTKVVGGVIPNQAVRVDKTKSETNTPVAGTVFDAQSIPLPTPTQTIESQQKVSAAKNITTNIKLPFPSKPKEPNVIVGMVLTPDQKIIEGAIIEIRDQNNIPVRATKTNKLGQFFSTTPLKNGHYEIEVEKEGLAFDILKLELSGGIIPPLQIQAK